MKIKKCKGECNFCGYITELEQSTWEMADIPDLMLCEICRTSWAGNAAHNPGQYDHPYILKSISVATNMILDAIKKGGGIGNE